MAKPFPLEAFRRRFPEYASVSDAIVLEYAEMAKCYSDCAGCDCGPCGDLIWMLLTAHLLYAEYGDDGQPGKPVGSRSIQSATIGSVSVSRGSSAATTTDEEWLMTSPYGPLLLPLLARCAGMPIAIGGSGERDASLKAYGIEKVSH